MVVNNDPQTSTPANTALLFTELSQHSEVGKRRFHYLKKKRT
jgi:hypothetical protein